MAHQTPLATWLYSKCSELNPQFKEFNWPSQVLPDVFDFETKISWGYVEADGRGVDHRREIALEKSVAEAIERLICKTLGFDSIGLAVAGTHDPSLHAKFECLERFYLNEHLNNSIPLTRITFSCPEVLKFQTVLPSADVSFYRMRTPENIFGIVCSIHAEKLNQSSLGFALSENLEQSIRRAFLEALPNFAWMISGEQIQIVDLPWHLQPSFIEKVKALFCDETISALKESSIPEVISVGLSLDTLPVLADAPLKIARYQIVGLK